MAACATTPATTKPPHGTPLPTKPPLDAYDRGMSEAALKDRPEIAAAVTA
jgi:hypothetical protein